MAKTKSKDKNQLNWQPIPDKIYFTIGEVSRLCDLKPHVLRYWEQEFPQLEPVKRRGNRRYYQKKDVLMVRQIQSLLYQQGFTIEGARQQISGNKAAVAEQPVVAQQPHQQERMSSGANEFIEKLLMSMKATLQTLEE